MLTFMVSMGIQAQEAIVTYDFKTNKFDQIIPFDEKVTFRFINIPKVVDTFNFTCDEIIKMDKPPIPFFNTIGIKSTFLKDTSASILSKKNFRPNKDYIFSIRFGKERPLYKIEHELLALKINNEGIIYKRLNDFLEEIRANRDFDALSKNSNSIMDSIRSDILKFSEEQLKKEISYNKDKDVFIEQNLLLGDLGTALHNVYTKIDEEEGRLKDKSDSTAVLRSALKDFENIMNSFEFFPTSNFDLLKTAIANLEKTDGSGSRFNFLSYTVNKLINLEQDLNSKFTEILIANIVLSNSYIIEFTGQSYPNSLVEQSRNYMAADIGMAYVPGIDQFVYFSHASIYLRPIKRSIPLNMYSGCDWYLNRISLDLGITLNSIAIENQRTGFGFSNTSDATKGLMIGAGFRVLTFAKVNGGAMIYRTKDPNPLINTYSHKASFYFGLSLDVSVYDAFKQNFTQKQ